MNTKFELYTQEEKEKIVKLREVNDKLDEFFAQQRENWGKEVEPLFESVKLQVSRETSSKILENQAYALSYRQKINDEVHSFLSKLSKQQSKIKKLTQDKFIHYALGGPVKTNMSEKTLLIEGHLAEEQRNIELIQNYIEFLRQLNKNLESFQFSMKNIIEILNYLK